MSEKLRFVRCAPDQADTESVRLFVESRNPSIVQNARYKGWARRDSRALPSVKLERPYNDEEYKEKTGRQAEKRTQFQIFKATLENFQVARFDKSFLVKGKLFEMLPFPPPPLHLRSVKTLRFTSFGEAVEGASKAMFRMKNLFLDGFDTS